MAFLDGLRYCIFYFNIKVILEFAEFAGNICLMQVLLQIMLISKVLLTDNSMSVQCYNFKPKIDLVHDFSHAFSITGNKMTCC